jgi:hypothetical protein
MKDKENLLSAAVKGSVAGLLGSIVLTASIKYAPPLLRKLGIDAPDPPAAAQKAVPPERLANKISKVVVGKNLDKEGKQVGGQVLHWSYGLGWGAFYGVVQSALRLPFLVDGTMLGAIMSATAATVIPALGVAPPADKVASNQRIMQASFVMAYAWTTALAYHALSNDSNK